MKAVVVTQPGNPDVLQVQDRPIPQPNETQVLIKVEAAGINRADLMMRQGKYGGETPPVLGLEVAGTIESCGPTVKQWKKGQRVCALIANGGYAEYALADARHCLPLPADLSMTEAAGLPETLFTVWSNVFQRTKILAGEILLVQGGTSGIGLTAIQMAKAFGVRVYATAGTDEKCAFACKWGADRCANYRTQDFEAEFSDTGVDVVLDYVGGDYTGKHLRLLRPEGRLCWLAGLDGVKTQINIMDVMSKRLQLTGSMLSPRTADFKAQLAADIEAKVWPLVQQGKIRTEVYRTFPLEQAAEAHRLMEKGEHIGKIILTV